MKEVTRYILKKEDNYFCNKFYNKKFFKK